MIVHDVTQGTDEWHALRLGKATSSEFDKILTPGKLTLSKQSDGYRNKLIAERLLGHAIDTVRTGYTDRGTELEEEARDWYSLRGADVRPVGFIETDCGKAGASTDGLIGEDGILEIKVPSAVQHVAYLLKPASGPAKYRLQLQGGLWIAEREWCDWVSYNPAMPSVVVRVHRDEEAIAAIREGVLAFCDQVDAAMDQIKKAA